MASISRWYNNFMNEYQDPWTRDWFMVGSPGKLALILIFYVYFCTKIGPRIMKNRKPLQLTKTIQFYDIIQVILNVYLVYEGIKCGWGTTYRFACEPIDYSGSEVGLRMRRGVWLYYMVKLTDLLDTVFFVLRKKYNQITFLHIYHHTLMPFCGFIGITFVPGGHGSLMGLINSFIHIILYAYYFLAAFGPEIQKYLWWKKYVTKLQLVQFFIIFVHNLQVLPRECSYPKFFNFLLAVQAGYFTYLFGSFYIRAYIEKKPQTTIIKEVTANGTTNHISNGHVKGKDENLNEKKSS
ncbi:elongation of very long chain fatty acids protein 7-like [Sitophilus oryzae]|uniref:Elongation of very long chain fatty acids protein n=1 Tax=Sitophilus oryzae TaxID=7048 RepID=A0A6J2XVE1_SITOR|nr:elongation of very long chain fatty acids protein 7-like [Sitophilus oryzae]XP_030755499.1 elongation of very long chain fatty acids protein 7-like [Sitophilus oryzae]XP_030755500.1 elongation of very long chain fatty acids protein 7-like [Sitophilus oryzae]XP_030755501.1 elongation of very long chain fatty acids protein 7-like [Sitophilus oryzae]XP_030755502.1 elongation of very long chain fatty acids protein 7-like [Sitophilus oryzae]